MVTFFIPPFYVSHLAYYLFNFIFHSFVLLTGIDYFCLYPYGYDL